MKYSLYITIDNNDEIENVFLADIKTMSKAQISKYLKEIAKDNYLEVESETKDA